MTEVYNSMRFQQHIKGCKKIVSSSKFTTLNSFIVKGPAKQMEVKMMVKATTPSDDVPRTAEYPCLWITASHDQHVSSFIMWTGAEGGEAHSVTKIANNLFNKRYGELSKCAKNLKLMQLRCMNGVSASITSRWPSILWNARGLFWHPRGKMALTPATSVLACMILTRDCSQVCRR